MVIMGHTVHDITKALLVKFMSHPIYDIIEGLLVCLMEHLLDIINTYNLIQPNDYKPNGHCVGL